MNEARYDTLAPAPERASKRKLPGSFNTETPKPSQQAALRPLRLPAVGASGGLPLLLRASVVCINIVLTASTEENKDAPKATLIAA